MPCLRREIDWCLPSLVDQRGIAIEPYVTILQPGTKVVVAAVGSFWGKVGEEEEGEGGLREADGGGVGVAQVARARWS